MPWRSAVPRRCVLPAARHSNRCCPCYATTGAMLRGARVGRTSMPSRRKKDCKHFTDTNFIPSRTNFPCSGWCLHRYRSAAGSAMFARSMAAHEIAAPERWQRRPVITRAHEYPISHAPAIRGAEHCSPARQSSLIWSRHGNPRARPSPFETQIDPTQGRRGTVPFRRNSSGTVPSSARDHDHWCRAC
jgi:hypothetical protein